jgi:very-short-patch-repair endonuclease
MGALMNPAASVSREARLPLRNRFASKVVDFVIADEELNPVALVELDDRTHSAAGDARRDAMTSAAGYETLRYESRHKPAAEQIRRDVLKCLKGGGRSRGR